MAEKLYMGNIQNCPNCQECYNQGLCWEDIEKCGRESFDHFFADVMKKSEEVLQQKQKI